MAAKLTPWFPGYVKPVRNGHYQVEREIWSNGRFANSVHMLWFLNGHWRYPMNTRFPGSLANMSMPSRWRGLASDPSKA